MTSMDRLDNLQSLQRKIDERAHDLFKEKDGLAPLQVTRVFRDRPVDEVEEKKKNAAQFVKDENVWDSSQVTALRNNLDDSIQIFTVTQDRSWTTLNISRGVFEHFMAANNMTSNFWNCVFSFGRKSEENEFEFPCFNRRKTRAGKMTGGMNYEFSYVLRRAELNGRNGQDGECPWSIRQTAVYHKLECVQDNLSPDRFGMVNKSKELRSTFLLLAPSKNVKSQIADCLEQKSSEEAMTLSCWNTHRIMLADSLMGWLDYMVFLQKKLKEQSNQIVLAIVGNNKANLSPLLNFNVNFEHRQELKIVEDQVLDLQVILPNMTDAIQRVRDACVTFLAESSMEDEKRFDLESIIEELKEHQRHANMLTDRAKTLKANAESTAKLLSDLLSYEEAVALKDLTSETQTESQLMRQMTEKGTKDAAAVKILTVITLVYLPFTIVANFFSTEFVKINDSNNMRVSRDVWLLAAISVPLTMLTVVLWWAWVHFTKLEPAESPENPGVVTLQRKHSIRSVGSSKKRKSTNDLESGLSSPQQAATLSFPSPASTWASKATTVKFG